MAKDKLAIFDLDGTLFDTTNVNYLAYRQALEEVGFSLEREYYVKKCNGNHYKKYLPDILGEKTQSLIEAVHERKKVLYNACLTEAKLNYHLFEMIKCMKKEYYIAIVTTASRKNTIDILDFFSKKEAFDYIITHEDVENVKPNPEGFCKCMEYFNMKPEATIIFEDSETGVKAAKSSLAKVLRVIA